MRCVCGWVKIRIAARLESLPGIEAMWQEGVSDKRGKCEG
jgi:hypothetical protein